MKILLTSFITFFCLTVTLFSQSLTNVRAQQFINCLINKCDSLQNFVLPEELSISNRLGINYNGIKNKFLISYEIPEQLVGELKNKNCDFSVKVENKSDDYSILHFEADRFNYRRDYFFKNSFLISPPFYLYKNWGKIESEHFIFYTSKPEYFNTYSMERLENFVTSIFSLLTYTKSEIQLLKDEKIIHVLCKDENEIEAVTGYKARGMYNLAYDYIITTFNCHYHELLHLLINYKLKDLPLYTHPFLQEGFAAAFGGRGGKEPEVILNVGNFLANSGFISYKELLNAEDFKNYDASMSYPLSALYTKYLIEEIGIENYLKLYMKYSASSINGMNIELADLLAESKWENFLKTNSYNQSININCDESEFKTITNGNNFIIKENEDSYFIQASDNLLISTNDVNENFISKTFSEFYSEGKYRGEKYLIRLNENEIAIYNLYTNNLIANYVSSFTLEMKSVPKKKNSYIFCVRKNLFDERFQECNIKTQEFK